MRPQTEPSVSPSRPQVAQPRRCGDQTYRGDHSRNQGAGTRIPNLLQHANRTGYGSEDGESSSRCIVATRS
jgi:hypothetical protein